MSATSNRIVRATTAQADYPIHIGRGLKNELAKEIAELRSQGAKLAVVTDANVAKVQAEILGDALDGLPVFPVPAGETSKSIAAFSLILDFLAANKLDRGGVLIALGGGVVGDLAGFAASAYLRGIRFIQIPTSLLAMVDSSVGGKTGVNIAAGKNLVGAFHQPISVYADIGFLETLPPREFIAGMAEVIKYGLLADAPLYRELESAPIRGYDAPALPDIIQRCCQIKVDVVKADETETAASGGRALLNLGHTFAHAIERVAGYGDYLHGEAVGIGLAAAARLSQRLGHISPEETAAIEAMLLAHGLQTRLRSPLSLEDLYAAMGQDKKVKAGTIRFVAMRGIGDAITTKGVEPAIIEAIWREIGAE